MREKIEAYSTESVNNIEGYTLKNKILFWCKEEAVRKLEKDLDLALRAFGELEQNPRISRLIPMYILNVFSKIKGK